MECICCNSNNFETFAEDSWLKIPVKKCKDCELLVTGNSIEELESTLKNYYLTHTENEELDRTIKFDFDTRHGRYLIKQNSSMIEYCKNELKVGQKLLEIGPGPGISLRMFEDLGLKVHGIEINVKCVEFINKKLKKGKCEQGFFDSLELHEKFNVIWISHTLEHIPRPDILLKKCKDMLLEDGIIFVGVPNCDNPEILSDGILYNADAFHYTKSTLKKIGENSGLECVKIDTLRELYRIEGRFHLTLEKYFKSLNKSLCPYYPFKLTAKDKGTELRAIFKKKK